MTRNVVINTWHGTMIVNRHDVAANKRGQKFGVGHQLMTSGAYDRREIELVTRILREIRAEKERPIVAHDIGANIGCHSLVWARELGDQIKICAVEAQPRIFEMLCGNVAINNRFQINPINVAVGGETGEITFAVPDYGASATFGSLELRQTERSEKIGQELDSSRTVTVPLRTLSDLRPGPPDFIKIDIEGMEEEALLSQEDFLAENSPVIFCEHIKSNGQALIDRFRRLGFQSFVAGINLVILRPESRVMEKVIGPRLQAEKGTPQAAKAD